MDFFRGYITLNGKKATQGFKKGTPLKTLEEVRNLDSYAGILADDGYRRLRSIGNVNANRGR